MTHSSLQVVIHRLSGLLRTRVLLSLIGLWIMYKEPTIGPWVVSLIGLALGVSAVDAWKNGSITGKGNEDGK